MGQTLSEPITSKETQSLQNDAVVVGSSAMQGWRMSMEDACTHILSLKDDPQSMYFGVFDGHGGSRVAIVAAAELHKHIVNQKEEYEGKKIEEAIIKGFIEFDESLKAQESIREDTAGSTAIIALIKEGRVYVGNAGDSRCIASRDGRALPLSFDHKPMDVEERDRIEKAGGFVEFNRINGNLALSRALGDFMYKRSDWLECHEQMVSCVPQVTSTLLDESVDFLILACDGIWDVLDNQEAVDFVCKRIADNLKPEVICEQLMMRCLSQDGGMSGVGCDNMTVIIVCFLHGKPYQRLVDKCARWCKQMGLSGGHSDVDDFVSSASEDDNSVANNVVNDVSKGNNDQTPLDNKDKMDDVNVSDIDANNALENVADKNESESKSE